MYEIKNVRPINSLIFISDLNGGDAPNPIRDVPILATPSCISVACYPEQEGATDVTLGDMQDVDPGRPANFDGNLNTPSRTIAVSTVDHKTILEKSVTKEAIHVRIWMNNPKWSDDIIIGVD